jgi:hypothetical protein
MQHLFYVATYPAKKIIGGAQAVWHWCRGSDSNSESKHDEEEGVELEELKGSQVFASASASDGDEEYFDSQPQDSEQSATHSWGDTIAGARKYWFPSETAEENSKSWGEWAEEYVRPFTVAGWSWLTWSWDKTSDFAYDAILNAINSGKSLGSFVLLFKLLSYAASGEAKFPRELLSPVFLMTGANFSVGEIRYFIERIKKMTEQFNRHTDNVLEWQELAFGAVALSAFLFERDARFFPALFALGVFLASLKWANPDYYKKGAVRSASGHRLPHAQGEVREGDKGENNFGSRLWSLFESLLRIAGVAGELLAPAVSTHFIFFTAVYFLIAPASIGWTVGFVAGLIALALRLSDYRLSRKYDFSEIEEMFWYKVSKFQSATTSELLAYIQMFSAFDAVRFFLTDEFINWFENPGLFLLFIAASLSVSVAAIPDILKVIKESYGKKTARFAEEQEVDQAFGEEPKEAELKESCAKVFSGKSKEREKKVYWGSWFWTLFEARDYSQPNDSEPSVSNYSS